jgi:hypothetical protein
MRERDEYVGIHYRSPDDGRFQIFPIFHRNFDVVGSLRPSPMMTWHPVESGE